MQAATSPGRKIARRILLRPAGNSDPVFSIL